MAKTIIGHGQMLEMRREIADAYQKETGLNTIAVDHKVEVDSVNGVDLIVTLSVNGSFLEHRSRLVDFWEIHYDGRF